MSHIYFVLLSNAALLHFIRAKTKVDPELTKIDNQIDTNCLIIVP